jgi:hypothetical protein
MEKHLRRAGILVSLGLIVQFLSLLPLHPLAFIGFHRAGCSYYDRWRDLLSALSCQPAGNGSRSLRPETETGLIGHR